MVTLTIFPALVSPKIEIAKLLDGRGGEMTRGYKVLSLLNR